MDLLVALCIEWVTLSQVADFGVSAQLTRTISRRKVLNFAKAKLLIS
jgi:hypothetical protein